MGAIKTLRHIGNLLMNMRATSEQLIFLSARRANIVNSVNDIPMPQMIINKVTKKYYFYVGGSGIDSMIESLVSFPI